MRRVRTAVRRVAILTTLLSFCAAGCLGARGHVRGFSCSELENAFIIQPHQYTMADFNDYDIDKQYAIYICGNQFVHPPRMYLAKLFAKGGDKVVDFLKARLLESDDPTVRDIVNVFVEMSRQKTYDVNGDSALMRIMEESVSRIKDPDWRRLSEQNLKRIQTTLGTKGDSLPIH